MITREGDSIIFKCAPPDVEILDFIEARLQLPDMERLIQIFIDQRRQQQEYDTKVALRELLKDPLAVKDIDAAIQAYKDRHPNE